MKLRYNHPDEFIRFIDSEDAIYHFTRKETAIEHVLNNQSLRLGDFKFTNDPQEYRPRMPLAVVGWGWEDEHIDKISEITRVIDNIIKSSGFLSFCQNRYDSDDLIEQGCLKSRMWSQYGDNHSGICLVFSKELLLQQVQEQLSDSLTIYSESVIYKDPHRSRDRDNLNVDGQELAEERTGEIALQHIENSYKKVFFQKQPDYKDENEFRVVAVARIGEQANGKFIDIAGCLKGIILGDAFPKVYLPTVQSLSSKLNVPYRKLHWEKDAYVLLQWNN